MYACGYVPILLLSFCHYRLRVLVMACLMLLASSILTLYSDTQLSRGYPLRVRGHVNLSATHTHTHLRALHTHSLPNLLLPLLSTHYVHNYVFTVYICHTLCTHYVHYMYTICTLCTLSTHYLHYVYVY